jgi:hypothetical protein
LLPTFAALTSDQKKEKTQGACFVGHFQHIAARGLYFHRVRDTTTCYFPWCEHEALIKAEHCRKCSIGKRDNHIMIRKDELIIGMAHTSSELMFFYYLFMHLYAIIIKLLIIAPTSTS